MSANRFCKTIVVVEVLHNEDRDFSSLADLANCIHQGESSGRIKWGTPVPLTIKELVAECERHHTDPEFFVAGGFCDECNEYIPDEEGGGLANKWHAESCSLFEKDSP